MDSSNKVIELRMEQPSAMTTLLQELLARDTYNKFCIDCNKNESTHVSITYGTFICEDCAKTHNMVLGMTHSYVKPVFGDLWDSYQIRIIQLGGNKRLWDFLKQYNGLEQKTINIKYGSNAAKYYRRMLSAEVSGHMFSEKEPPKNAEEYLDRGVDGAKTIAVGAKNGIVKVGGQIGEQWGKLGVGEKISGFFAKK